MAMGPGAMARGQWAMAHGPMGHGRCHDVLLLVQEKDLPVREECNRLVLKHLFDTRCTGFNLEMIAMEIRRQSGDDRDGDP